MTQEELNKEENMPENAQEGANQTDNNDQNDINADNASENAASEQNNSVNNDDTQNHLNDLNDKYLRLVAEFDNFRKRNAKERIELIKTASEDMIKSLLEVMDDMDRAESLFEKATDIQELKNGIQLIFNKFRSTLTAKGLEPMNATNQEFNPDTHEAITEIPAPSEDMVGKVVDEVIKGYTLNDKIIRHAKVVVGK